MPKGEKATAYQILEKSSNGNPLRFTGLVKIPNGQVSGSVWTNLGKYFNGNTNNIISLHNQEEIAGSWENLSKGVKEGTISTNSMIVECFSNLKI